MRLLSCEWFVLSKSDKWSLSSNSHHRFFHAPRGVLLTHYQVYDQAHWKREPGVTVYLSVLKRLAVDPEDGALRMLWWEANEALKSPTPRPIAGGRMALDARSGSIVEGSITWGAEGGVCFPYTGGVRSVLRPSQSTLIRGRARPKVVARAVRDCVGVF